MQPPEEVISIESFVGGSSAASPIHSSSAAAAAVQCRHKLHLCGPIAVYVDE